MELLISANYKDNHFDVYGELDNTGEYTPTEPINVEVLVNGEKEEEFGETFVGHKLNSEDVAEQLICAYMNNDKNIVVSEISKQIENYKTENQKVVNGIEQNFFATFGKIVPLVAYTDKNAYYICAEEEKFIVTEREENTIITDYENFFLSALVEDFKANVLKYNDEDFKEWLEEYMEEE